MDIPELLGQYGEEYRALNEKHQAGAAKGNDTLKALQSRAETADGEIARQKDDLDRAETAMLIARSFDRLKDEIRQFGINMKTEDPGEARVASLRDALCASARMRAQIGRRVGECRRAIGEIDKAFDGAADALAAKVKDQIAHEASVSAPELDLGMEYEAPESLPASLRVGNLAVDTGPDEIRRLCGEDGRVTFPWSLDLERNRPLCLAAGAHAHDAAVTAGITAVILRFLSAIPPAQMEINLFDFSEPLEIRNIVGAFRGGAADAAKTAIGDLAFNVRLRAEVFARLDQALESAYEKMRLGGFLKFSELFEADQTEKERLLVVRGGVRAMNEQELQAFCNTVRLGRSCGLFVLLVDDCEGEEEARRSAEWKRLYGELMAGMDVLRFDGESFAAAGGIKASFTSLDGCTPPVIGDYCRKIAEAVGSRKSAGLTYEEIGFGTHSGGVDEAIEIPIGKSGSGIWSIAFRCDDIPPFANLIVGESGSGKSALVDNMVLNGAMKYSPDDLLFYLLDFKDGISSSVYSSEKGRIPHVKIVAEHNSVEDAEIILNMLLVEKTRRNRLFSGLGVTDIRQYNRLTEKHLPRIVVVIDECQKMFGAADPDDRAMAMCEDLVRQGRSVGIHLVLVSQDMSSRVMQKIGKFIEGRYCFSIERESASAIIGRKYAAVIGTEAPKGSHIAFASTDRGETCSRLRSAFYGEGRMQFYIDQIRERYASFPQEQIVVGQSGPFLYEDALAPYYEPAHVLASPDTVSIPFAQNYYDHSIMELQFSRMAKSALFMIGANNPSLPENVFLSVVRAARRCDTMTVYVADGSVGAPSALKKELSGCPGSNIRYCGLTGFLPMLAEVYDLAERRKNDPGGPCDPVFVLVSNIQNFNEFKTDIPLFPAAPVTEASPVKEDPAGEKRLSFAERNRLSEANRPGGGGRHDAVGSQAAILELFGSGNICNLFFCFSVDTLSNLHRVARLGESACETCNKLIYREIADLYGCVESGFKPAMLRNCSNAMAVYDRLGTFSKVRPISFIQTALTEGTL